AQLRLLWSLRPRKPWGRWSQAVTVFELALDAEAGAALLARQPDLLLADLPAPAILLCGRGVVFQDQVFLSAPRTVEARARRNFEGIEYELVVGDIRLRFASDPTPLVDRLERWFLWHFNDFLPQTAGVFGWKAPAQAHRMRLREAVHCPECGRPLLARLRQVPQVIRAARPQPPPAFHTPSPP